VRARGQLRRHKDIREEQANALHLVLPRLERQRRVEPRDGPPRLIDREERAVNGVARQADRAVLGQDGELGAELRRLSLRRRDDLLVLADAAGGVDERVSDGRRQERQDAERISASSLDEEAAVALDDPTYDRRLEHADAPPVPPFLVRQPAELVRRSMRQQSTCW